MHKFKFDILGIKISLKCPFLHGKHIFRNKGKNNIINISKDINASVKVVGNNNIINVTNNASDLLGSYNLKINIKGNDNRITIVDADTIDLNIDIGNSIGVNGVNVEIGEKFHCAKVNILAFKSNAPVIIGKNCMFSNTVNIRTGEYPHVIYDTNTLEDLDNSKGVFIGNNVWIGEHAYIMKNAKIPDNCIVGSMSVVTKSFDESNIVIAGNPAKICKRNIMWGRGPEDLPSKI